MKSLARNVTQLLVEQEIIESSDFEIYHYGIQLILSDVWIFSGIIGMGILVGKMLIGILFIIAFVGLRHYTGGYHANRYYKCFLLSCGSFIITLLMIGIQERWHLNYSLVVCSVLCTFYLCKIGSINSKKNPKTEEEMLHRKKATRIITCVYTGISCVLILMMHRYLEIATLLICTQIFATLAIWVTRKEKK